MLFKGYIFAENPHGFIVCIMFNEDLISALNWINLVKFNICHGGCRGTILLSKICSFPISLAKPFDEKRVTSEKRVFCHDVKLSAWKKKKNRKAWKYLKKGPSMEERFMWKVAVNFDVLKFILLDTFII